MGNLVLSKTLYVAYAVWPDKREAAAFTLGTPAQVGGRARYLDKLGVSCHESPLLVDKLPPLEREFFEQFHDMLEIWLVPAENDQPVGDDPYNALKEGLPGQLRMGDQYSWEHYQAG